MEKTENTQLRGKNAEIIIIRERGVEQMFGGPLHVMTHDKKKFRKFEEIPPSDQQENSSRQALLHLETNNNQSIAGWAMGWLLKFTGQST